MSFIGVGDDETGIVNPFEAASKDPRLYVPAESIKLELKDFRQKECRTVWGIDANPSMKHFERAWIRYYEQVGKENALLDLKLRFRLPDSLCIEILQTGVEKRLLLYKKRQYGLFKNAMEMSGLTVDLSLIATWDRERPIAEEFVIMGLYGDIEPCESMLRPEWVKKALSDKMNDPVLRRDERGMLAEKVKMYRQATWDRFLAAYEIFVRWSVS